MDLISIIVPVYNVEKYINTCVESILKQTYRDLEIILVDDGSTDASGELCDELAKMDSRIVVMHKENGGLSDTRNAGLDCATGEWIMFVDSDDFIHPDTVKLSLEIAQKNQSDLLAFGYMYVDEQCDYVQTTLGYVNETVYTEDQLLRAFAKQDTGSVMACNKLYRKSIWEEIRFPVGKIHEDEFVIVDVLQRANNATVIDAKLYFYRQRQGSIMATRNLKSEYDALEAFELRCEKLKDDEELYCLSRSRYLSQLIRLYFLEGKAQRKILLKKYRNSYATSWKWVHWKANLYGLAFRVCPWICAVYDAVKKEMNNEDHIDIATDVGCAGCLRRNDRTADYNAD